MLECGNGFALQLIEEKRVGRLVRSWRRMEVLAGGRNHSSYTQRLAGHEVMQARYAVHSLQCSSWYINRHFGIQPDNPA